MGLANAGLARRFRDLRQAAARRMLQQGIHPKIVQERSEAELAAIKGIGPRKVADFGPALLALVGASGTGLPDAP